MTHWIHPGRLILLVGAACSQDSAPAAVVQSKSGPVNVQSLAKLDNPWGMTFLPDGRLLITEKPGRLRVFADGKLSGPIAGVPKVAYQGPGRAARRRDRPRLCQQPSGLPLLLRAGRGAAAGRPREADHRLGASFRPTTRNSRAARWPAARLEGDQLADLKVIWRQVPKTIGRGHFGGRLVFGPDGKLYITSGERSGSSRRRTSQRTSARSSASTPTGRSRTTTRSSHPSGARSGHLDLRPPQPTGHRVQPDDARAMGQRDGPQGRRRVNVIEKGKNYGWPVVSDGNNTTTPRSRATTPARSSTRRCESWNPVISPSGMIFYTGSMFPQWKGNVLIGGLSSKAVIRLTLDGNKVTNEDRLNMGFRVPPGMAPDGAVLLLSDGNNGELLRLTPAEKSGR